MCRATSVISYNVGPEHVTKVPEYLSEHKGCNCLWALCTRGFGVLSCRLRLRRSHFELCHEGENKVKIVYCESLFVHFIINMNQYKAKIVVLLLSVMYLGIVLS